MGSVDQTKSRLGGTGSFVAEDAAPGMAYLLVLENDSSSIFQLPRSGDVVIGRAPDVELKLTHASVSRRHATIRIDGGVMRIADLDSHNGTRVNGEPVAESRALASGDVASVGDVVLVVNVSHPNAPARSAYGEAGWRRRLIEELERAITFRRELAVIAVIATGVPSAVLGSALRLIDVVGQTDDGQPLLLLPEADRAAARAIAMRVLEIAPHAALGLAVCPVDACDADAILLAARSAARGAKPGTIAEPSEAITRLELGPRHVFLADPAMTRVFGLLERLASSQLPVLVTGETGVGKENAAYAVHHWSKRQGPFVAVNCASIAPESLVESELFGHDKGAFTGATAAKAGLFESAAGGTVFLDEVGELPLAIQAKLLRALETQRITRLGESRERAIDVRLVAATNRTLEHEVEAGRFRQDLYFRLGGATVILPPLRDRKTEIPILAREFLGQGTTRAGRAPMTITPAAMQVLLTHTWPGNVRELRNTMEYVVAAAPDELVEPSDLPERLGGTATVVAATTGPTPVIDAAAQRDPASFRAIAEELRELERRRMSEALVASGGVKTRAAQLIDMPIRTFTLKLKQYKL
ncbi:MAG: sigma 54-dependent Fis family transcriptional regulator [Myxococcota bacterium]|nr:sigma 54-dependent Fis family transcriptional regulator [Myxococcota bacterium]